MNYDALNQQIAKANKQKIVQMNSSTNSYQMSNNGSKMDGMSSMQMNMIMPLNWKNNQVIFLFQCFHAESSGEFFGGCVFVIVVCVAIQLLGVSAVRKMLIGGSYGREKKGDKQTTFLTQYYENMSEQSKNRNLVKANQSVNRKKESEIKQNKNINYLIRLFLYHFGYCLLNLLLMLLAMTMNCYIIISICAGSAIGKILLQKIQVMMDDGGNKNQEEVQVHEMKNINNYSLT